MIGSNKGMSWLSDAQAHNVLAGSIAMLLIASCPRAQLPQQECPRTSQEQRLPKQSPEKTSQPCLEYFQMFTPQIERSIPEM